MAPTASDDSPTETARASMNSKPVSRTRVPRAAAMSVLTVVSSSGRQATAMPASATALKAMTAGMVPLVTVKIEPNRICAGAPVVAPEEASR